MKRNARRGKSADWRDRPPGHGRILPKAPPRPPPPSGILKEIARPGPARQSVPARPAVPPAKQKAEHALQRAMLDAVREHNRNGRGRGRGRSRGPPPPHSRPKQPGGFLGAALGPNPHRHRHRF